MFEPESFSISPINFFALSCDCHQLSKKERIPSLTNYLLPSSYLLPTTQKLTHEKSFAKVAMGWCEEGIGLQILVNHAPSQSFYPAVEQGDAVELFFDTRDVKISGFNTRFCHHFFFLPSAVDGISKGEKTHFRTEDRHPLCDPSDLDCQVQSKKKEYVMKIFIPSQCLVGYDPKQFNRMGFTYRISRYGGEPQHFSVLSQEYQIEQQPSLWASLNLI